MVYMWLYHERNCAAAKRPRCMSAPAAKYLACSPIVMGIYIAEATYDISLLTKKFLCRAIKTGAQEECCSWILTRASGTG